MVREHFNRNITRSLKLMLSQNTLTNGRNLLPRVLYLLERRRKAVEELIGKAQYSKIISTITDLWSSLAISANPILVAAGAFSSGKSSLFSPYGDKIPGERSPTTRFYLMFEASADIQEPAYEVSYIGTNEAWRQLEHVLNLMRAELDETFGTGIEIWHNGFCSRCGRSAGQHLKQSIC